MRIGIEINGVLRDTLKKIQEVYEKWFIENRFDDDEEPKGEVFSELNSLEIMKHLKFKDEIYETFFQRKSIQAVIKRHQLDLLVVNIEKEEIVQWIN